MSSSLALDSTTWDLTVDSLKNIAVVSEGGALAQDVASAIKLFFGELWYAKDIGVPYFSQILGQNYSKSSVEGLLQIAALSVPGVVSATATVTSLTNRYLTGTVVVTNEAGVSTIVTI